jgi:hypothetical protein
MKLVTKYQISAINSCWEKCDEKWAYMFNVNTNQQSRQAGSRNLSRHLIFGHKLHIGIPYRGKRFWTHQIPTSCLPILFIFIHIEHICSFFVTFFSATIDQMSAINSCWENVTKNQLICSMSITINKVGKQEVGIWRVQKRFPQYGIPIWSLLLSNYWRQESDIWSQTSYRYAILWEAFLDPSDSYFLLADLVGFYTHWTVHIQMYVQCV